MGLLKKYDKDVATQTSPLIRNPNAPLESPFSNPNQEVSFGITSLDLENPNPLGGPINAPQYGHQQKYLPQPNRGYDDSSQGQIRGDGALQTSFNKTSLDLENPLPLGGPINEPFQTIIGSEVKSFNTTQPFTPQNTYKDSLKSAELRRRASDPIR